MAHEEMPGSGYTITWLPEDGQDKVKCTVRDDGLLDYIKENFGGTRAPDRKSIVFGKSDWENHGGKEAFAEFLQGEISKHQVPGLDGIAEALGERTDKKPWVIT